MVVIYLMEVTSQPRATANLQIREPRKPLPPQTTIFLAADFDMAIWVCLRFISGNGEDVDKMAVTEI
jgi:hypothetical protein